MRSHPFGKACRNGVVRHCRVMAQSVWRKSVILLWQMQSRMIFVLKKGVVLTGANASGKSTFMKAVAINVILAQTINTCVAKNMKMPAIQVMTSMALRDDVLQGESYYMREIKYLKRMLDELKTGESMLFVIDEILKGTNTRERLAASNAILSYMVQKQGFLLIATHDLELVYALKNRYDTYYFDSQVHEKRYRFSIQNQTWDRRENKCHRFDGIAGFSRRNYRPGTA